MLAVSDASAALAWYKRALGATELWNLGSVVGMEIGGAPIFLGEPAGNGWETPAKLGAPSVRVEVFCDDPAPSEVSTASGTMRCPGELTGRAISSTRSGTSGWWVTDHL